MDDSSRKVVHSSDRMDWRTPKDLFDSLNKEFLFNFDAAADAKNALCQHYATESGAHILSGSGEWVWQSNSESGGGIDGLHVPWGLRTFCNPPYGRGVGNWFKKAYEEALLGKTCVLVVGARTDTKYWHQWAMKATEIRLVKGRIKFTLPDGKSSAPAPFPSAILIYRPYPQYEKLEFKSWHWNK